MCASDRFRGCIGLRATFRVTVKMVKGGSLFMAGEPTDGYVRPRCGALLLSR